MPINKKLLTKEQYRERLIRRFADMSTDGWTTVNYNFNTIEITQLGGGRIEVDFEYAFSLVMMLLKIEDKMKGLARDLLALDEDDHNLAVKAL